MKSIDGGCRSVTHAAAYRLSVGGLCFGTPGFRFGEAEFL